MFLIIENKNTYINFAMFEIVSNKFKSATLLALLSTFGSV